MSKIRKTWAEKVGKASNLVVKFRIETSVEKSQDPACLIQGCIGIPSSPESDDEKYYLARVLVNETVLPIIRPDLDIRILDMTIEQNTVQKHTVEVENIAMPRFMWWEKEYVENPYMRALPMKQLNQRFFDIITNSHEISAGGKLGIRFGTNDTMWMKFFQHVLVEAKMRELPFPFFLDDRYSLNLSKDSLVSSVKEGYSTRAFDACTRWIKRSNREFDLVKYGEYRHMEDFLKKGQMLIQPSQNFADESYNLAVKDDENSVSVFGIRIKDGTAIPAHRLRGREGRYSMMEFSASMDRDYMMYCMAGVLSPTLFSHFGSYDSCVLIHDMKEFTKRVSEGTKASFLPESFDYAYGKVTYLDPLDAIKPTPSLSEDSEKTIPFLKHFRHTYQDEFRFVWTPKTRGKQNLEKVVISIGSLEDIAEIIRI